MWKFSDRRNIFALQKGDRENLCKIIQDKGQYKKDSIGSICEKITKDGEGANPCDRIRIYEIFPKGKLGHTINNNLKAYGITVKTIPFNELGFGYFIPTKMYAKSKEYTDGLPLPLGGEFEKDKNGFILIKVRKIEEDLESSVHVQSTVVKRIDPRFTTDHRSVEYVLQR